MAKELTFTISIKGDGKTVSTITEVQRIIKDINKELQKTDDIDGIKSLEKDLNNAKVAMKGLREEQKKVMSDIEKSNFAAGSYKALSNELGSLKKQYKELGAAERDGVAGAAIKKRIQELDAELKKIDAGVGVFSRNVGNYPKKILASIEATVPGFQAFKEQIDSLVGSTGAASRALVTGFIAFQAGKFIYQAIAAIGDFVKEIEKTKKVVEDFSGASGENLSQLTADTTALATTFEVDAQTIAKAANALAQETGVSFNEALKQIESGLVAGQADNEAYLDSISEAPEKFKAAANGVSEYAQANRALLESNRELAQAEVAVADRLAGATNTVTNFGIKAKAFLLNTLVAIFDFLSPLGNALGKLFGVLGSIISQFTKGTEQGGYFTALFRLAVAPIRLFINIISSTINFIADLISGIGKFISDSPILTAAIDGITYAMNLFADIIANLPEYLASALEAVGNFVDSTLDYITFGLYGTVKNATADLLKQVQAQTQQAATNTKSFLDDFFSKAKQINEQLKAEAAVAVKVAKESEAAAKKREEANKKAEESNKKRVEDRKKFLEDEIKEEQQRNALILELQNRLIDQQISLISSESDRKNAEIERSFKKEIEKLNEQYNKLVIETTKREEELRKLFGDNHEKTKQIQLANAQDLALVKQNVDAAIIQLELLKNKELAAAQKEFADAELQKQVDFLQKQRTIREKILSDTITDIQNSEELKLLKIEEINERQLSAETDSAKRTQLERLRIEQETITKIAAIRAKLAALDQQDKIIQANIQVGITVPPDEIQAVVLARQKLNTELAKLENQQTQQAAAEADKRKAKRQAEFQTALSTTSQVLDLVGQFEQAATDREQKRIDDKITAQNQQIEDLQTQLEGASGLERRFLLERIETEKKAAKDVEAEKAKIQKEAARNQRIIALGQAAINTAVSVTSALAQPPGPPITIPAGILAGALGAAQIALIAAQGFARGGLVGNGNIKARSNGDNVFATVKTGEVVLTEAHQAALGGASTFRAIGVPGFASGGVVGSIVPSASLAAPSVSTSLNSNAEKMFSSFDARTKELERIVLTSKVVLDTDELDKTNAQKSLIARNTQFS